MAEYMNGTNQLAIQGVDYPADVAGFLAGGSPIGAAVMYGPSPFSPLHSDLRILQGQINQHHPRCLSLNAPPPLGLLARRASSASRRGLSAREHHGENLLGGLIRGSKEWNSDSGRGSE
jgi:hypothetical protein